MNHNFTCNPTEIREVLTGLKRLKWKNEYGAKRYVDEATGTEFELWIYESEYLEKEITILKKKPWPTATQLIHIALTSQDMDEIASVSLELYFQEEAGALEFRAELAAELVKYDLTTINEFERRRLLTIIYESSLADSRNLKSIMNKSWEEVFQDAAYYEDASRKARNILITLEKLMES